MMPERDAVATSLEAAVRATLSGQCADAESALKDIVVSRPVLDTSALVAQPAADAGRTRAKRKNVTLATQIAIFRRDNFTCRYCGKQTTFLPLARLLSALCPSALPYHTHGKFGSCHLLFWTHMASIEHVVPVAAGGDNDENNLATACYWCNDWKSHWTVERLGWTLHPSSESAWDGLSRYYPALYDRYARGREAAPEAYFRLWLRALAPSEGGAGISTRAAEPRIDETEPQPQPTSRHHVESDDCSTSSDTSERNQVSVIVGKRGAP